MVPIRGWPAQVAIRKERSSGTRQLAASTATERMNHIGNNWEQDVPIATRQQHGWMSAHLTIIRLTSRFEAGMKRPHVRPAMPARSMKTYRSPAKGAMPFRISTALQWDRNAKPAMLRPNGPTCGSTTRRIPPFPSSAPMKQPNATPATGRMPIPQP